MSERLSSSSQEHKNKSDIVFNACEVPNVTSFREVAARRAVFD